MELDLSELLGGGVEEKNVIESWGATLFLEEKEDTVSIPIPEDLQKKHGMPETAAFQRQEPSYDYILYQNEFEGTSKGIRKIWKALRDADEDSNLTVHVCSPGGTVVEGRTTIDIFKKNFHGRVTTYLDGEASSMGAMMFSAGDKRVITESSLIMYHDIASWGGYEKYGQKERTARAINEWADGMFKRDIIDKKFITPEEYRHIKSGEDMFIGAEAMAVRGIATHVEVDGEELTAEEYVDYLISGFTIDEFINWKEAEAELEEETVDMEAVKTLLEALGIPVELMTEEEPEEEPEEDEPSEEEIDSFIKEYLINAANENTPDGIRAARVLSKEFSVIDYKPEGEEDGEEDTI